MSEPHDLTQLPGVRELLAEVRLTLPVGGPFPYGSAGAVAFRELGGRELVVSAAPGLVTVLPLSEGMHVYEPRHARRIARVLLASANEAESRLRTSRLL